MKETSLGLGFLREGASGAISFPTVSDVTYKPVAFDGVGDRLTRAANPFPATAEYFTLAIRFKPAALTAEHTFLWANSNMRIGLNTSGRVVANFSGVGGDNLTQTIGATVPAGSYSTLQIAARNAVAAVNSQLEISVNGAVEAQILPGASAVSGGFAFSTYTSWIVAAASGPTNLLYGTVSWIWFTAGAAATHFVNRNKFSFYQLGRDYSLGANGNVPTGVQPIFFMGNSGMEYLDWNVGLNLGSDAGTWTMVNKAIV